jgi:hypothetical protein
MRPRARQVAKSAASISQYRDTNPTMAFDGSQNSTCLPLLHQAVACGLETQIPFGMIVFALKSFTTKQDSSRNVKKCAS